MGMFAAGCVFTARPMVLILRVYLSALFRRRGGVEERRRAFQADGLWARSKAALPRHIVHAFVSLALLPNVRAADVTHTMLMVF